MLFPVHHRGWELSFLAPSFDIQVVDKGLPAFIASHPFKPWPEFRENGSHPNVPILTLGQPVVEALVTGGSKKVREYWGYRPNNQYDPSLFKCSSPRDNRLNRVIIAFPHIRSSSKEFYKGARPAFTKFIRDILFP